MLDMPGMLVISGKYLTFDGDYDQDMDVIESFTNKHPYFLQGTSEDYVVLLGTEEKLDQMKVFKFTVNPRNESEHYLMLDDGMTSAVMRICQLIEDRFECYSDRLAIVAKNPEATTEDIELNRRCLEAIAPNADFEYIGRSGGHVAIAAWKASDEDYKHSLFFEDSESEDVIEFLINNICLEDFDEFMELLTDVVTMVDQYLAIGYSVA